MLFTTPGRCVAVKGYALSHAPWSGYVLLACLIVLLLSAPPLLQAREDGRIEKQRTLFVAVEAALKAGHRRSFKRSRESLQNYPLYPYLVYHDLRRRLTSADKAEITGFLGTYGGVVPVAEKLRHRWLTQLARRGRWADFFEYYRESVIVENKENRCHYATALIRAGRVEQAQKIVKSLWLVNFSQPPQCDFAFKWGFEQGVLKDDLIWKRMILVWGKGKEGLVNYLGGRLGEDARRWSKPLKQARYHPERTALKMREQLTVSSYASDVMTFALRRLIRKDVVKAGAVWSRVKRDCSGCDGLRTIEREIGITAARQLMPAEAYRWLSQLPPAYRNDESRYWRVRAALRMQSWEKVIASIDDIQGEGRAFPQWRYWRAHALAALGRHQEAQDIWQQLAEKDDYYGYLAADKLKRPYPHALDSLEFSELEMVELNAYPGIVRIRELVALNRPFDASRELSLLLESLDTPTRFKFADAADRWGWPIGVIRSLAADDATPHLQERFPMPYRSLIEKESRRSEVPMEWIYGIMRRESAFVERIKSPVGALGLMQLRPRTARAVAKRLGMGRVSNQKILSPKINMRLGTAYIKRLYRKNSGNLSYSLAGYNAGPTRVRHWLNKAPVSEIEVWVDTIPYDETRLYVRAVLFYTLVYRHLLGKPQMRLHELMN